MSTFESAVRGSARFSVVAPDLAQGIKLAAERWEKFSGSSDGLPWSADVTASELVTAGDGTVLQYEFDVTVSWSRTTVTKPDA